MKYSINYEQVLRQANRIEEEAQQIQSNMKKLDGLMTDVRGSWDSPAAKVFLSKCELLKSDMTENYSRIRNVANTIRTVARQIKQQDERAAERAKLLKG